MSRTAKRSGRTARRGSRSASRPPEPPRPHRQRSRGKWCTSAPYAKEGKEHAMLRRFRSRRLAILGLGLWLVILLASRPVRAEQSPPNPTDTELFSVPGTTPNVVLLFDTSGSMSQCPNGADPVANPGACGTSAYSSAVTYTPVTYITIAVYRKISGS